MPFTSCFRFSCSCFQCALFASCYGWRVEVKNAVGKVFAFENRWKLSRFAPSHLQWIHYTHSITWLVVLHTMYSERKSLGKSRNEEKDRRSRKNQLKKNQSIFTFYKMQPLLKRDHKNFFHSRWMRTPSTHTHTQLHTHRFMCNIENGQEKTKNEPSIYKS